MTRSNATIGAVTSVITMFLGSFLVAPAAVLPQGGGEGGGVACGAASRMPESRIFYGESRELLGKVDYQASWVNTHRLFVVCVESELGAELFLVERHQQDEAAVAISHWTLDLLTELRVKEEIHETILVNHGRACVGELSKRVIATYVSGQESRRAVAPFPIAPLDVISQAMEALSGQYLRIEIMLLC